ncbi:MAG: TIGR04255 family protein [Thermotogae bacterium]|nr:TIGR04255 family protein [Thermotogota bacterium]
MERKILKNKPLVEAIFEFRWKLQEPSIGVKIDPHYKILIGRMYDRVKDEYPFHEQLPAATMPDEIAGYVVQHRFRKDKDKWPLIQIGPGIITLNDTEGLCMGRF